MLWCIGELDGCIEEIDGVYRELLEWRCTMKNLLKVSVLIILLEKLDDLNYFDNFYFVYFNHLLCRITKIELGYRVVL